MGVANDHDDAHETSMSGRLRNRKPGPKGSPWLHRQEGQELGSLSGLLIWVLSAVVTTKVMLL